jgi:glycosyltransferase involved in cell wall biosynthesis
MSNKKVSIVVPIYNVEKYLHSCIDSILNQTMRDVEVILVDDGSSDNCGRICDEYSLIDSRVKVIHKKNGGLSEARNFGIREAQGEYLLIVDSDDWCESNMVEELYDCMIKNKTDVVVCGYEINYTSNDFVLCKNFEGDTSFLGKDNIADAIYKLDTLGMFNVVWNKFYKTEIIKKNNLMFEKDGMPGEDLIFNCEYFKYIDSIGFISRSLYHYMRSEEVTLVSKYRENLYEQVQRFNVARKNLYDFYNMKTNEYIKCYINKFIENIFACIPNLFRKDCNLTAQQKKDMIKRLMEDKQVREYIDVFTTVSVYDKLFKATFSTNKPLVVYLIYVVLFKFRYVFDRIYNKYRNKFIY